MGKGPEAFQAEESIATLAIHRSFGAHLGSLIFAVLLALEAGLLGDLLAGMGATFTIPTFLTNCSSILASHELY